MLALIILIVDTIVVGVLIHIGSIEVEDCGVATGGVHRVVEVIEANEENLIQSLLCLWSMRPCLLEVVCPVALDSSSLLDESIALILIILVDILVVIVLL